MSASSSMAIEPPLPSPPFPRGRTHTKGRRGIGPTSPRATPPSPSGRVGVAIQDAPVGEGREAQQHGVEGEVAEGGEGIPAVQAEEEMEYVEA